MGAPLLAARFSVWLRHMEKHFHFTFVVVVVAHLVLSSRILALFLSLPSLLSALSRSRCRTTWPSTMATPHVTPSYWSSVVAVRLCPLPSPADRSCWWNSAHHRLAPLRAPRRRCCRSTGFNLRWVTPFPCPRIGNHQVISSCLSRLRCNSWTFRVPRTRRTRSPASSGYVVRGVAYWRIPSIRWHRTLRVCIICRAWASSRPSTISVCRVAPTAKQEDYINPCPALRFGFLCWNSIWTPSLDRLMRLLWVQLACCRRRKIAAACCASGMAHYGMLPFARILTGKGSRFSTHMHS